MPGQDQPLGAKNRETPPLGYPYRLQSPLQEQTWDSKPQKNILSPVCYSFSPVPPCSALPDDVMVTMTTTDPQLNLKRAIKLQFEGPTSVALHKRETPLWLVRKWSRTFLDAQGDVSSFWQWFTGFKWEEIIPFFSILSENQRKKRLNDIKAFFCFTCCVGGVEHILTDKIMLIYLV